MTGDQIAALIPHAGAMCLLDRVVAWSDGSIHCRSATHRDPVHPLLRDGRLAAVHLIEYGAQAAAVHGGLLAREGGGGALTDGMLAGIRDITLLGDDIHTSAAPLDIYAHREMGGAQGLIYRFEAQSAGATLASGRLTIMGAKKRAG